MALPQPMRRILDLARRSNASDVHLVAGVPPTFRVSGEIILADTAPLSAEQVGQLALSLLNDVQKEEFEHSWQICCSVFDEEFGRFRVSVYLHCGRPEAAIRPVLNQLYTREELRLPEIVEDLTRLPSGLVLITGPTGSGKTTTMNFMVDLINSERRCKVITIEDPVEYVHARKKAIVVQQELYTDVKSFSQALVHVLRQDPDVIGVGEMRDYETTATGLVAAETGHLVIATCHTPNAVQTVERIVSVFPYQQQPQVVTQLSNCLQGIIAQRLIPAADKKRRLLACEVLMATPAARHHIRKQQFHQLVSVMQTGQAEGMQTMDDSLRDLYEAGEITYDAAVGNASNPQHMREELSGDQS